MASSPLCARGQLGVPCLAAGISLPSFTPCLGAPSPMSLLVPYAPNPHAVPQFPEGPGKQVLLRVKLQGSYTKSKGLSTCHPLPRLHAGSGCPSHAWCQPPPPSCAGTQRQMSVPAEQAQRRGDGWQFNDAARHCLANAIIRATSRSRAGCPTAAPPAQLRLCPSSCTAQSKWGVVGHPLPLECTEIPINGIPVQWLEQAHPPLPSALLR